MFQFVLTDKLLPKRFYTYGLSDLCHNRVLGVQTKMIELHVFKHHFQAFTLFPDFISDSKSTHDPPL